MSIIFDWYISGPLTSYGSLTENVTKFNEAARELRARGWRVFSPPEDEPLGGTWSSYIRRDLKYLADSGGLVLLPNWNKSKGAKLEKSIAVALGMQVVKLDELLKEAE